jgi:hypothetical protein
VDRAMGQLLGILLVDPLLRNPGFAHLSIVAGRAFCLDGAVYDFFQADGP